MVTVLKDESEIGAIHAAGRAVWRALEAGLAACRPGATTAEIAARIAEAEPAVRRLTVSICIGDEAAFVPPGDRRLRPGDLTTVDVAGEVGGWWADAARALAVEPAAPTARSMAEAAESVLGAALAALGPDVPWSSVARAMRERARERGVGLAHALAGHGVGRRLHEGPALSTAAQPGGSGDVLMRPGMVLTVEPCVTGDAAGRLVEGVDGVMRTADGGPACTEERTVAMLTNGVRILTGR